MVLQLHKDIPLCKLELCIVCLITGASMGGNTAARTTTRDSGIYMAIDCTKQVPDSGKLCYTHDPIHSLHHD